MRSRFAMVLTPVLFLCFAAVDAGATDRLRVFRVGGAQGAGSAAKPASAPDGKRAPKLALALAGGGARAAASLGVLKVLEREGIRVSAVTGTSGGSDEPPSGNNSSNPWLTLKSFTASGDILCPRREMLA